MNTRTLVRLSLLTTLALALSFLETLIPNPFPIPGAKLGLANSVTLYMLKDYRPGEILTVILARIFLAGFLFGSLSSIIYALSGALLSFMIMLLLNKFKFNLISVSVMGGISHNYGQLLMAVVITKTPALIVSYGFYMILFGFLTGLFNGILVFYLRRYLPRL